MTVAVIYGEDKDKAPAEQVASALRSKGLTAISSAAPQSDNETQTVDYTSFDGVVAVGGPESNEVYTSLEQEFDWDPVQGLFGQRDAVVNGFNYIGGVPIVGIAGFEAEDTVAAVEGFLNPASSVFTSIESGISRFVDEVEGEDQDPDPEPPTNSEEEYVYKAGYNDLFGAGDFLVQSAATLQNKLGNLASGQLKGYDIRNVEVDRENDIIEVYFVETGSISLLAAGTIIAAALSGLGISLAWWQVEEEKTQRTQARNDEVDDAEQELEDIISDPNASEETKEAARQTLVDLQGSTNPPEGEDGSGFLGSGVKFEEALKGVVLVMVVLIALQLADSVPDFTGE